MKYIKKFENIISVGYYVLLYKNFDDEYNNFISNNIGIVVDLYNIINGEVGIKYDNVPSSLVDYFRSDGYRIFYSYQIEHISCDRDDLDAILQSKKYNL